MLRLTKPVKKYLEFGMYCGGAYTGQHKFITINVAGNDMTRLLPNRSIWIHATSTSQNTLDISMTCRFDATDFDTALILFPDSEFDITISIFDLLNSLDLETNVILYKDKDMDLTKLKPANMRLYGSSALEWGSIGSAWNDPNDHPIEIILTDMLANGMLSMFVGEIHDFDRYNSKGHKMYYLITHSTFTLHFLEPIFTSEYMKSGEKKTS